MPKFGKLCRAVSHLYKLMWESKRFPIGWISFTLFYVSKLSDVFQIPGVLTDIFANNQCFSSRLFSENKWNEV